jgi:hypothetical protein
MRALQSVQEKPVPVQCCKKGNNYSFSPQQKFCEPTMAGSCRHVGGYEAHHLCRSSFVRNDIIAD